MKTLNEQGFPFGTTFKTYLLRSQQKGNYTKKTFFSNDISSSGIMHVDFAGLALFDVALVRSSPIINCGKEFWINCSLTLSMELKAEVKNIVKGTKDPRRWVLDSFKIFSSKQKLQKALKHLSNFNFCFILFGKEIHRTTLMFERSM